MVACQLSPAALSALEHARDTGADPALLVLAHALEDALADAILKERVYHRMDRMLSVCLDPASRGRRTRAL
jgi:uncharacterized protein (DUF2225 family)